MKLENLAAALLALLATACAHDSQGRTARTGETRFDETSVSNRKMILALEENGTWSNRYRRVGDRIQSIGSPWASLGFPLGSADQDDSPLIHGAPYIPSDGWVTIRTLPNGVSYIPSWVSGGIWTFVTADGHPLPGDLEVPLYLAAKFGLTGQWVRLWSGADSNSFTQARPVSVERGSPNFEGPCGLILFTIRERPVAGWVSRQGATCPRPVYPSLDSLADITFDEVWESPYRHLP